MNSEIEGKNVQVNYTIFDQTSGTGSLFDSNNDIEIQEENIPHIDGTTVLLPACFFSALLQNLMSENFETQKSVIFDLCSTLDSIPGDFYRTLLVFYFQKVKAKGISMNYYNQITMAAEAVIFDDNDWKKYDERMKFLLKKWSKHLKKILDIAC